MALASALSTSTPGGDVDMGTKFFYVFGTITPSGSYVTGGDTLDFTAVTKPVGTMGVPGSSTAPPSIPTQVYIQGKNGYSYAYVAGTTRANGKMKVLTAPNTEIAQAAYPANVTSDVITFQAAFPRL